MRLLSVTLMLLGSFILGFCARSASGADRMYCYHDIPQHGVRGGGKVQVNGFKVEVGPVADPDGVDSVSCRATITSSDGKVVYEESDWGFEIDPATGKDINGDDQPDAVLVGFSGGAHCCWTYDIVSLGKQPGLIRQFENQSHASFSDLRGDGKIEIIIRDGTFDFSFGLGHALAPFPMLIVRLNGSEFQDVGSEFWPVFEKEIQEKRGNLDNAELQKFLRPNTTQVDNSDFEMTRSTVLQIALDYLYGGKPQEAKATLSTLWPAASRERTWKEMLDGYCSGLRSQLGLEMRPPCKNGKTNATSAF